MGIEAVTREDIVLNIQDAELETLDADRMVDTGFDHLACILDRIFR